MDGRGISLLLISLLLSGCSAGSAVSPVETRDRLDLVSDEALRRVAEQALGDTEGSVIVIDPQTGHLRAVINPRLAVEQSFPPGSAIKPFTLLAAWRSGLIDPEAKRVCRTRYDHDGFSIVCSHPPSATPFSVDQALAWSCNDFFAHVGERLSEGTFNGLLSEFGFGQRTCAAAAENPGQLKPGEWKVANALGEGDALLVTPIQLLRAYCALVNGGNLIRPSFESNVTRVARRINLPSQYREKLMMGMRGAVQYGTASKSGLARLTPPVYGKTGTSTSSNGFRSQGWFIGFASDGETAKLGVLVFVRRGNGAKAAMIASGVFDCALAGRNCDRAISVANISMRDRSTVRVRTIREGITRELPVEDYLTGVLAGEAGAEKQLEALRAQAVISRTFALRNMGRHAAEGYDFCSTTHCQRFVTSGKSTRGLTRRAVASTAGLILVDSAGNPVDAYYHAACGGRTADIETLWGVRPAPEYLRGVSDDYCSAMPHRRWTQTIGAESLRRALVSDERSDVGSRLRSMRVIRRDASGRVERLSVEGSRRIELSGWEFKMIAGRQLGWQMIKSSLFSVNRSGDSFVFQGGGFGHGLGLCQEGAHGAAQRGLRFNRILDHYFPGTRLVSGNIPAVRGPNGDDRFGLVSVAGTAAGTVPSADILSSEHFHLRVMRGPLNRSPQDALRLFETALRDLDSRLERASVPVSRGRPIEVVIHATTADYITVTGLSGWSAGATRGNSIQLQPLEILRKRRIFETTIRHELAHVVIEQTGGGRTPGWLAEGLAVHFAGEAASLPDVSQLPGLSPAEIDERLAKRNSQREMRILYARAYQKVKEMIRQYGEPHLWKMAATKNQDTHERRTL